MIFPVKNEGKEMIQAVLKITGKVVPCRTTSLLNDAELNSGTEKSKQKKFDEEILRIYGDSMSVPEPVSKTPDIDLPDFLGDEVAELVHTLDEYPVDETRKAVFETPFTDLPIHSKVMLPHGEELQSGKVKVQTKDLNGNFIWNL